MSNTIHKRTQYSRNSIAKNSEQKNLKTLTQGLNQSRIAVQHITYSRKEEEYLKDNICLVKQELHNCVISINNEQKRNKVLKELVCVLKGQMSKMETKEVESKQKQQAEINKRLKQIQNDIDKINHKKNQQVAKIATLKQNSSQSRSQRVVYSNLFKKLESQLKHHEELYKNQLLKVQNTKLGSEITHKQQERVVSRGNQLQQPLIYKNNLNQGTTLSPKKSNRYQSSFQHNTDETWLTGLKQQKQPFIHHQLSLNFSISDSKAKNIRVSKSGKPNSSNSMTKTQKSKLLMEDLIKFKQRLLLETGCESVEEVKETHDKIGEQNQEMLENISLTNDKIEYFQKQLDKINKQKQFQQQQIIKSNYFNNQQYEESTLISFNQNNHPASPFHQLELNHQASDTLKLSLLDKPKDEEDIEFQFGQICKLFICPQDGRQNVVGFLCVKQMFSQMDYCIQQVLFETKSIQNNDQLIYQSDLDNRKQNLHIQPHSSSKIKTYNEIKRRDSIDLNVLLSRMEKFSQCERLIDRNGFCREYKQELNKKTKTRAKRL